MILRMTDVPSPIGTLTLVASDRGLHVLAFPDEADAALSRAREAFPGAEERRERDPRGYATRLAKYLDGDLRAIDDIPVDPSGTPFQLRVWRELRNIPAGRTVSYRDLAVAIGKPTATRAVGLANSQNPIAIVIPCHRVIASDGGLCGYGGGLPRKRWLLTHEGALPTRDLFAADVRCAAP